MPETAQAFSEWQSGVATRRERLGLPSTLAKDMADYTVAPIASGDVVGAATEFARWLRRNRDRSLVAIEMEAAGAAYAAYARTEDVPMLVVRGVSDLADERKADLDQTTSALGKGVWRRYATMNAVDLLVCVLTGAAITRAAPAPHALDISTLERLERLIVARYPTPAELERLIRYANMNPMWIAESETAFLLAHRCVRAADERGMLEQLVNAIRRDHPDDPELARLAI